MNIPESRPIYPEGVCCRGRSSRFLLHHSGDLEIAIPRSSYYLQTCKMVIFTVFQSGLGSKPLSLGGTTIFVISITLSRTHDMILSSLRTLVGTFIRRRLSLYSLMSYLPFHCPRLLSEFPLERLLFCFRETISCILGVSVYVM